MTLRGKTVVITGAGRGLGAAFALSLTGCNLFLCGRRMDALQDIAARVVGLGGAAPRCVVLDLADATGVAKAVAQIETLTSSVDILINNGDVAGA